MELAFAGELRPADTDLRGGDAQCHDLGRKPQTPHDLIYTATRRTSMTHSKSTWYNHNYLCDISFMHFFISVNFVFALTPEDIRYSILDIL